MYIPQKFLPKSRQKLLRSAPGQSFPSVAVMPLAAKVLKKVMVNICARARRSTSKVSFAPVAGKITVSPVTSPKFLLRPQAPCRCWDVSQVLRLSRKRGNSSAVSLSRNRRRGRITGFQTISRSDRADCDNRPAPFCAGHHRRDENERIFQNTSGAA